MIGKNVARSTDLDAMLTAYGFMVRAEFVCCECVLEHVVLSLSRAGVGSETSGLKTGRQITNGKPLIGMWIM